MNRAGVSYAVLGSRERCTGDAARRAGNEYLFQELANRNVEILNQIAPPRIVTTCPHCLHTLNNEYVDFGGHYDVIHHTQLIEELLATGALIPSDTVDLGSLTFHDPCYLGRQNGEYEAPRTSLQTAGLKITELPRNRSRSFCCGAGGAQAWKEEEAGEKRVSEERIEEARRTGEATLAVGCPFCKMMLNDAAAGGSDIEVRDVAEIVLDRLDAGPDKVGQPSKDDRAPREKTAGKRDA
jgi:Fe-S oxidoreductase